MAIYSINREKDLLLGVWKMEETIPDLLSSFAEANKYLEFITRFSSDKRKKEWLTTRVLLQYLLGEEKEITYSSSGKPFLKDKSYHISISHTKGYVAVALHPYLNLGVDIEYHHDKVLRVKGKFLQTIEEENITKENEVLHLLLHFSSKESVYKLINDEELELKAHLMVEAFMPEGQGEFYVKECKTGNEQKFLIRYWVDSEFVLTYTLDCL